MKGSKSLYASIVLHVILIAILVCTIKTATAPLIVQKSNKIVHATAVESTEVERVEKKLALEQKKKHDAEVARQKAIQRKAEEARQKKIAEANKKKQAELAKKKLAEQKKAAEALKAKQALAKKQAADRKALAAKELAKAKQQQEALQLQQQIAAKKAEEARQQAQALQGVVDKYKALILEAIAQQWLVPEGTSKDISCELSIRLAPGGAVLDVQLMRGSGNAALDRSAVAAVYKATPLPVPTDSAGFEAFRQFNLVVKPEGYL